MKVTKNNFGTYFFVPSKNVDNKKGAIVFIHGYATTSSYHDVFIKYINNDYDYYAIQLPGHGYEEYEDKNNKNYINQFVIYCCKLINNLNIGKFYLIGHSMGGGIGIRVANLLKKDVLAYVAVTPMNSRLPITSIINYWKFSPKTFKQTLKLNTRIYKDFFKTVGETNSIEDYISKEAEYQKKHHLFFKKLKKNMFSLKNVKECRKNEKLLSIPTLIIAGKYDKLINAKSTIKVFNKSNKKYVSIEILENSAHIPFQEEEEKYANIVLHFFENNKKSSL